jgi:hypothetical protein
MIEPNPDKRATAKELLSHIGTKSQPALPHGEKHKTSPLNRHPSVSVIHVAPNNPPAYTPPPPPSSQFHDNGGTKL